MGSPFKWLRTSKFSTHISEWISQPSRCCSWYGYLHLSSFHQSNGINAKLWSSPLSNFLSSSCHFLSHTNQYSALTFVLENHSGHCCRAIDHTPPSYKAAGAVNVRVCRSKHNAKLKSNKCLPYYKFSLNCVAVFSTCYCHLQISEISMCSSSGGQNCIIQHLVSSKL